MPFDQGTITRADVQFRADTGEFKTDITEARRVYHQSTGAMSDDALRLAVAQEKLDRAIARSGPTSTSAKTATLGLRRELEQLESQQRQTASASDRAAGALGREQRELGRFGRGALVGTGALHGLGRAAAFASTSFLGGAGLIYGIKSALKAASDLHEQTSKTEVVFDKASGSVIRFSRNALGLARDQALEAASSIGALLRPLGVLPEEAAKISVELTRRGVDLASFYNTTVADALAAIQSGLVGQVRPLRRYGAALDAARVTELALAQTGKDHASQLTNQEKVYARVALILRDTSLAQGDYKRTIGGVANQEREVERNIRNTEETIGTKLEPRYLHLLQTVNQYLGSARNQEEITRHVERALHDAGLVAKGFARGLDLIHKAISPVVAALGGLDNAAEAALIAGLLLKARRAAVGFGLITAASHRTRTAVVADAGAEQAAMSKLGRGFAIPVTIAITATFAYPWLKKLLEKDFGADFQGTTSAGDLLPVPNRKSPTGYVDPNTGKPAPPPRKIRGRNLPNGLVVQPETHGRQKVVAVQESNPRAATIVPDGTPVVDDTGTIVGYTKNGRVVVGAAPPHGGTRQKGTRSPSQTSGAVGKSGGGGGLEDRLSRARLGVARGTPGAEAELTAALRAQIAYDRKYERIQEDLIRRGIGNRKEHLATLDRLRSDEESALNEIQSINDKRARSAKTAAAKKESAAKRQHAQQLHQVSTLPKRFTIRENDADTLPELGAVYRSELAFQKKVVAGLRRRHAAPDVIEAALVEESTIQAKINRNRQAVANKQRKARDTAYQKLLDEIGQPSLALRIRQAKIDVAKAHGKDTSGDELKLLQAELAEAGREYQAALKVANTRKKKDEVTLAYWEERAQLEEQIAGLKHSSDSSTKQEIRDFITEYTGLLGLYAPNVTGGRGTELNVHFNMPAGSPQPDRQREYAYAKHAFGAAFD